MSDFLIEIGLFSNERAAGNRADVSRDEAGGGSSVEDESSVCGGQFFLPDSERGKVGGFGGDVVDRSEVFDVAGGSIGVVGRFFVAIGDDDRGEDLCARRLSGAFESVGSGAIALGSADADGSRGVGDWNFFVCQDGIFEFFSDIGGIFWR